MSSIARLAETGALVGEPTRTAMLITLMDGRALTAGELARAAGVAPATASGHLGQLVDGGLLAVAAQGRHRYFCLASPAVAGMIESMMGVAGVAEAARRNRPIRSGPANQALRRARRCYDHLAGDVAVRLADFLVATGYLEWTPETATLTPAGSDFLNRIGVDLGGRPLSRAREPCQPAFCRPCMDWSERRPHIAGGVGRSLLQFFLDRQWMCSCPASRALAVTRAGEAALTQLFQI